MIGLDEHKFPFRLFASIFDRLPIGGAGGQGISLAQLSTELNSRNLDSTHMDRIDENVSAPKQVDITTANGTFTLPNGTSEQDAIEFLLNDEEIEITFDMTLLAQSTTVRLYGKTDGVTYRVVESAVFPADFDGNNVVFALNGKGRDQRITFQSAIAEGATRDIPHARVEEIRA